MLRSLSVAIVACAVSALSATSQTVRGTVSNALDGVAVEAARVTLLDAGGTPVVSGSTTRDGSFALRVPDPGAYSVAVGAEGFASTVQEIELPESDADTRIDIVLRPLAEEGERAVSEAEYRAMVVRSIRRTCGSDFDPDRHGLVMGVVTDFSTGVPLPGLRVALEWRERNDAGESVSRSSAVLTDENGGYVHCSVPGGETVTVASDALDRVDAERIVAVERGGVHREDFALEFSDPEAPGFVFGRVMDPETVTPIVGALVRIPELDLEVLSDKNGFFRIAEVPWGVYMLDVEHISYAKQTRSFRVQGSTAHNLEIEMRKDAIELEGLTVSVQSRRWFSDMDGMRRRMAAGFGHFISPEKLELRNVSRLSDALRDVPGLRVRPQGASGATVFVRGKTCMPQVFVDGRLYRLDPIVGFNETFGTDIYAIEVYTGPASIPAEFAYGNNNCGAVVLWTKRGR